MMQIDVTGLSKSYGQQKVFEGLNLTLTNQQINFIIGANGTGKSTFLKCLLKLIKYQGRIEGNQVAIAYMPERLTLPDYVRVTDFLRLIGQVRGQDLLQLELILNDYFDKFAMKQHRDKSIMTLSKGTKQKVLLIQALMTEADIYIFDEPLHGLDPTSQAIFHEELKCLRKKRKLIIITTHHINSYRFKNKKVFDFNQKMNDDLQVNQVTS